MGMLKRRVCAEDVVINCSADSKVSCSVPSHILSRAVTIFPICHGLPLCPHLLWCDDMA